MDFFIGKAKAKWLFICLRKLLFAVYLSSIKKNLMENSSTVLFGATAGEYKKAQHHRVWFVCKTLNYAFNFDFCYLTSENWEIFYWNFFSTK
jgi:hypothetical protein